MASIATRLASAYTSCRQSASTVATGTFSLSQAQLNLDVGYLKGLFQSSRQNRLVTSSDKPIMQPRVLEYKTPGRRKHFKSSRFRASAIIAGRYRITVYPAPVYVVDMLERGRYVRSLNLYTQLVQCDMEMRDYRGGVT